MGKSVPMEFSLAPRGCSIVRDFFHALLSLHDKTGQKKIDVGVFMREYVAIECGKRIYKGNKRTCANDPELMSIVRMRVQGLTYREIGEAIGKTGKSVQELFEKYCKEEFDRRKISRAV